MEKTAIGACPNLVNDVGFEIDIQGSWNMLPRASLGEKRAEALIRVRRRVFFQASIRLP